MSKCHKCHYAEATIHLSSKEGHGLWLCSNCHNEILAKELGIKLEDIPSSLAIPDQKGELRYFNVEVKLHPMGLRMEAAENKPYGYKFEVDDELDSDQQLLFERLVQKVKRGLETTYIKEGRFPNGESYQTMRRDTLAGRIESNEKDWEVPILVIDGRPYSWDEVGEMVMSNEGFQIRMEIFEMTDDVE